MYHYPKPEQHSGKNNPFSQQFWKGANLLETVAIFFWILGNKLLQGYQSHKRMSKITPLEKTMNTVTDLPDLLDAKLLLAALTALKKGDFSVRMPSDLTGLNGKIADTLNEIIDNSDRMANEIASVSRVVGHEGRLLQRAMPVNATGGWGTIVNSVNALIDDLVRPTTEMARVIGAVAKGDLSQAMELEVDGRRLRGQFLRAATTANTMVSQLSSFASEVTRVAREVGTEGKLGGQANVPGVAGTWKDLTDSVNSMAGNLTSQVRNIADVTTAVANGDLSKKITVDVRGEILQLKDTINTMVDQLRSFASEVTRVAREVGTEGKLGGQAYVPGVGGTWKDLTDNVNFMASNLTGQVRNIAEVTTAVANGDLSKKIAADAKGEILQLKDTINVMVDQLSSFASEVTRVAREVGTEGKLGGQAQVKGVGGTWKDLTDSVNSMAGNLTGQVRNIADVTTAVANGDLSKKITADAKGEILELKNTINVMVDQLSSFASEVTRVAREVGSEGKLGGQAQVKGVGGTWKDLTDNVNFMASNLTGQVRNIAEVTTAVANGDLSKKITVDVKGEIFELKDTINVMVDQLNSFASEVTRVAREVGTEGELGGQANVPGVAGTWKDLTDSVNSMAGNLTGQVRNIADVTTAVANGDLSKKITADAKGEILELKNTINVMVDQLSSFASEVTRVAREVGTEGELGGQANVPGVAGTWKDLTDSVNSMAGNLTGQVRNIAEVTTAVANGDLSKKITVDVKGEILELKNTINVMVDQLSSFASEVTRVAREVGTEGKLGGQANVPGVAGTWKDLTDSVNSMAGNLTSQVRNIADVTTAVANGDLSKKITVDVRGEILQLKDTINTMVDQLRSFASEVTRVAREVGTEGRLGGQANVPGASGTWKDLTDNVNFMASNLTGQVRNIAEVTTAVANGDLSKKITVDVKGEILELKDTINVMVDQLSSFASEVTRVAREVGTEGKLGGQAQVKGVGGTWKDLTENVNFMAANLTAQVRGIAGVVTAVAKGDLKKKLTVAAQGEIASLANTINEMTDTLAVFADQVTTVAREVGVEGKLGGQASVPGASGTWKDLTENVNQLAANLTTQVRAIAEVATAVTRGDLSRSIQVEARGEVSDLKDNINEMIRNLKETTQKNAEQDWLKTNLARFTRQLQGQRDLEAVTKLILSELAPLVSAHHGVFYMMDSAQARNHAKLQMIASYGYRPNSDVPTSFAPGEGLVGQCAVEKNRVWLTNVPRDYITVSSGLGAAPPTNIVVLPILFEQQVKAVIEIASLDRFTPTHMGFLDQLMETIGVVLNTIEANTRTESLLTQSQSLAQELQQTNLELAEKARLLSDQNSEVERKNREVEQAKIALEEKATQLTLSSKYKSEFLANMSHELRTPLNSLLILAQQLGDNPNGNLSPNQVEYAKTIHGSGSDLLTLINDILDLSKIESGTVTLELSESRFPVLANYVERTFRHMAEAKHISFAITLEPSLPAAMVTDTTRLQQILKNLLSNAFKFTAHGQVQLRIGLAERGWSPDHPYLGKADGVLAFSVTDTGVGIAGDKLQLIFEAFQQADGSTARRYGGTGLGLSISRELARLLGGEIRVTSAVGVGSTFTLFLPYNRSGLLQQAPLLQPLSPALQFAPSFHPASPLEGMPDDVLLRPASGDSDILPFVQAETTFDDRNVIAPGDAAILIVEDDQRFAKVLLDCAREKGFKGVVTFSGDATLTLARDYLPTAILLDIDLPDADGFTVLDRLKRDPTTRHIPVHILSNCAERERGLRKGAISYLVKPVTLERLDEELTRIQQFLVRSKRSLLVVEDDKVQRDRIVELIGDADLLITAVDSGQKALGALKAGRFDCMVLDLTLSDIDGFRLLDLISKNPAQHDLPIVIYTAKELDRKEVAKLSRVAKTIVVKDARSPERLLNETALFLHRSPASLPERQRRILEDIHVSEGDLVGRKVLIVDDDLRNIFALTTVLERQQMVVSFAENGRDGIELLEKDPSIEIVLMDIMMPEMDGYDTMRAIRNIHQFKSLPIITLTAKAMKGDRDKCFAAGASDYITKPVDVAQLLSLMRVWLSE